MSEAIKEYYIDLLKDSKIVDIKRICDLVNITFLTSDDKKIFLHIQCFFRIFDNDGTLVVCTQNMLDRSLTFKKEKFDWTIPDATIFDDAIKDYQKKIYSTTIYSVKFNHNDLEIVFTNKMRMNVLITSTKYDNNNYSENYRIFNDTHNMDLIL